MYLLNPKKKIEQNKTK